MANKQKLLAFEESGKIRFKVKLKDKTTKIEESEKKKVIRDKLLDAAKKAELGAQKLKGELIKIAQKETAKVKEAEKVKNDAIAESEKQWVEADRAAINAISEAGIAERELTLAKDAVINIEIEEQAESRNCIEVSEEDQLTLLDEVNSQKNSILVIKDGVLAIEQVPDDVLWNDILLKIENILRRTDKIVSIPDHDINGVVITEEQYDAVRAYRKQLIEIKRKIIRGDLDKPEEFVLPTPPPNIE